MMLYVTELSSRRIYSGLPHAPAVAARYQLRLLLWNTHSRIVLQLDG
jgi:hypothetical protein